MSDRFRDAVARIDAFNATDPKRLRRGGRDVAEAIDYAERMTAWLARLDPDASEALRLAARAQHIGRWTIPRNRYPEGTAGYNRWRRELARFHAETAGRLMEESGYDPATIARVGALIRKEGLGRDPETQALEDAACLVFLEAGFDDFSRRHPDDKVVDIVAKTWRKMGPKGRALALELVGGLPPDRAQLVARAVAAADAQAAPRTRA
ncbi:MAG: DUF4202 domain-containing protein [Gemmatimonas sp.]